MLMLSRHKDEEIIIVHNKTGERLVLQVIDILRPRVKLGFVDSAGNFTMIRKELLTKEGSNVEFFKKTGCRTKEIQTDASTSEG